MERLTEEFKGRYGIKTIKGIKPAYEISAQENTMQVISEFQDGINKLAQYEDTGLTPEEVFKLKQELENWKRESISDKAKLGEIRIWLEPIGVTIEKHWKR